MRRVSSETPRPTSPSSWSFTPEDPVKRAHMRTLMHFIDEMAAAAVRVPTFNLAFLPKFQAMKRDDFIAMAESKPLRKEFMMAMGQTGFPQGLAGPRPVIIRFPLQRAQPGMPPDQRGFQDGCREGVVVILQQQPDPAGNGPARQAAQGVTIQQHLSRLSRMQAT